MVRSENCLDIKYALYNNEKFLKNENVERVFL